MKMINLETGKKVYYTVSNKGFNVRFKYGIKDYCTKSTRTYAIVNDDLLAIFNDYTPLPAAGFFIHNIETGEKFLVMRG